MLMSETKAISTHRVFQGHINEHDSLFGGQTLAWLDESASIAAQTLARRQLVTGSVDSMAYVHPVLLGHALTYTSMVVGVGGRSLEVFTKLVGEDLLSGERYLAGYAFTTFVSPSKTPLAALELDDEEGRRLAAGYQARREANRARRQALPEIGL